MMGIVAESFERSREAMRVEFMAVGSVGTM